MRLTWTWLAASLALSCGGVAQSPGSAAGGASAAEGVSDGGVVGLCAQVSDSDLLASILNAASSTAGAPLTNADIAKVTQLTVRAAGALDGIECLTALRDLTIAAGAPLTSLAPLANVPSLRTLNISSTNIVELTPLAPLALESLTAHNTNVTDISALAGMASLQRLILYSSKVASVAPVAKLTALKDLELADTPVSELTNLSGLAALTALGIDGTLVTSLAGVGAPAAADSCLMAQRVPLSAASVSSDLPRLAALGWKIVWSSPDGTQHSNDSVCGSGRI